MANKFRNLLRFAWSTPPVRAGATDQDLLAEYFDHDRQDAFSTVMHRHAPLVYNVCRRVLNDDHEAEDAFQATFLVLAKRPAAKGVRSLGGWLYYVAYRIAMRRRRQLGTRRSHERQAMKNQVLQSARSTQPELDLRDVLDEELAQLPTKYREPLIHCDMMGQTHEQAARELRMPRGSLARWLTGAREALRMRLERRGIAMSAAALTAVTVQESMASPPPSLLALALQTVAQKNTPHLISATVVSQAEQMIRSMRWKAFRGVFSMALISCLVGAIAWASFVGIPNARLAESKKVIFHCKDPVASVCFSADGKRIASATWDGAISLWDIESRKEDRLFDPAAANVKELFPFPGRIVLWSPDGRSIATKQASEFVQMWSVRNRVKKTLGSKSESPSLAFSHDGKSLAMVNKDNAIEIWETVTGKRVWSARAKDPVHGLAFSPDNSYLATVEGEETVHLRNLVTRANRVFKFDTKVRQLAFSGDGNALLALANGVEFRTLDDRKIKSIGGDQYVECFALSGDGKLLAGGSGDSHAPFVYLWDGATGKLLDKLKGHGAEINSLCFSQDGTRLVSGGTDKVILVWSVER